MPPEISVVMINRNESAWLPAAADSVLAQTHPSFELVIVDDASSDRSPELISSLAARHTQIRPVLLRENAGISGARNRGIENASGKFIALIDSDDCYLPDTLRAMASAFRQVAELLPDTVMLATDAWLINEAGQRRGRYISPEYFESLHVGPPPAGVQSLDWPPQIEGCTIRQIPPPMWLLPSTWFFPKAVRTRFHEPYRIVDAPIFLARMAAEGRIAFLGLPLVDYRIRMSSVTNSKGSLNLRIRNATAESIRLGRLTDPLGPDEVPEPPWRQVASWTHGRNAKAAALNERKWKALTETVRAAIADPSGTFRRVVRSARSGALRNT